MKENVITDLFLDKFKYYKANKPKPSISEILTTEKCNTNEITDITPDNVAEDLRTDFLGLRKTKEWQIYTFQRHPGLLLIRNPFTSIGQRYWVRRCLEEYPRKPNKLNIDIEISLDNWWRECFIGDICNKPLLKKLRWTTLGYHHNWDTKVYSEENKSPFPEDLAELTDVVAQYLGYEHFRAEAAIVNYYHMNSTLSAHTDHSEVNFDAPLFSFSFGQSAIFLIGGRDKSTQPSAVLINSGDVVVMSKEARLCYHAVPKILAATTCPWNDDYLSPNVSGAPNFKYLSNHADLISLMNENRDNGKWSRFSDYIQESRINMNVRQVLNEKQKSLTDPNFTET